MKAKHRFPIFLILLLLFAALYFVYAREIKPYIRDVAENCVVNAASDEILSAVNAELCEYGEDFTSFVILEKDVGGNITAIRTNMALMNGLKNRIMKRVSAELLSMDEKTLSVPLGSMFFPSFFGISGPYLKTRIVALSSSDSAIESKITEAGINQAQQTITIHVQVLLNLITPVGTQTASVTSDIPVAETVIVGLVPNAYFDNVRQKG